jgi:hypothetical protein
MQLSTSCNEEKILIPGVETNPDLDNRVLLRTGVATNFLSIDIPSLFFSSQSSFLNCKLDNAGFKYIPSIFKNFHPVIISVRLCLFTDIQ